MAGRLSPIKGEYVKDVALFGGRGMRWLKERDGDAVGECGRARCGEGEETPGEAARIKEIMERTESQEPQEGRGEREVNECFFYLH